MVEATALSTVTEYLAAGFVAGGVVSVLQSILFSRRKLPPLEVTFSPQVVSPPGDVPAAREIVFVDYLDRDLIEEIAKQKGIPTGSTTMEDELSESDSVEVGSTVELKGGLPAGVLAAGASSTRARAYERSRTRRQALQSTHSARSLIDAVVEALERDDQLRRDLCELPAANETDGMVLSAAIAAWADWGINALPDNTPADHHLKELDRAIDSLIEEATQRISSAKSDELKRVAAGETETFALVFTEWEVTESEERLFMESTWLVEDGASETPLYSALVPGLVRVPLDRAKLIGIGAHRLRQGAAVTAKVLGIVSNFDDEDDSLTLIPLAVFGSQRAL